MDETTVEDGQNHMHVSSSTPEKKQRSNFFVRFLRFVLVLVLIIICVLGVWCAFSALHRKQALALLPQDYSLYVHMDSAWEAIEPLIDLRAADLLLASPEFLQFRASFMQLRSSALRNNRLIQFLLSRRIDIGMYTQSGDAHDFVAIIDLGVFSAVSRLAPFLLPRMDIPQLITWYGAAVTYFEYTYEGMTFYIAPYRNVLVVSMQKTLFDTALRADNDVAYTKEERAFLTHNDGQPIRIIANARKLVQSFITENTLTAHLTPLLASDALSVVAFGISDAEITVTAHLPLMLPEENPLTPLLKKNASLPALFSRLSDNVHYYTIVNIGSLEELKTALFPLLAANQHTNIGDLWRTANSMSRTLFSLPIDEVLFSWTGAEFAVCGVEGLQEPVFAVQIKDELQRQQVFNSVLSSIIVTDDTSLILDGVRLPKLMVPGFFQRILALFDINLPSPYYMVQDGFIYFSKSPETLSALHTAVQAGKRLSKNENWQRVSTAQQSLATVSLFYNLERNVPFFLRGNGTVSNILQLYTIGRSDIRIKDDVLTFQLQAVARRSGELRAIPGFPIQLSGMPDAALQVEPGQRPKTIFWIENERTIHALELSSMKQYTHELGDRATIVATARATKGGGVLWAVTEQGAVYLFTRELEIVPQFPILTGERPSARPNVSGDALVVPIASGGLCTVFATGGMSFVSLPLTGSLLAAPTVLGNTIAVYDKSFAGKIFFIENDVCINEDAPFTVAGIAFGSPALIQKNNVRYTAFITQAGNLYLWHGDQLLSDAPKKLDGVFYTNVIACGDFFFALSADAQVYRIALDGTTTAVAIPNATAREGYISTAEPNHNNVHNIYVCVDGNTIYVFSEQLELLSGFPLTGWGTPVFADVNGDHVADCFALTIDRQLTAWNLR